jgi:hypothetical protein
MAAQLHKGSLLLCFFNVITPTLTPTDACWGPRETLEIPMLLVAHLKTERKYELC